MTWKVGKNWPMGNGRGRERNESQETSYNEFLKGQFLGPVLAIFSWSALAYEVSRLLKSEDEGA